MERADPLFSQAVASRMVVPHQSTEEQFLNLIECLISLVVRNPMHREGAVRSVEGVRGEIDQKERNALIGLNIRHSHTSALREIGGRGKAMVLFSPNREFIFGDGFFNNVQAPAQHLYNPKMLVPLTPRISVLFTRPMSYGVEPKIVTLVVSPEETDALNYAVQVYSKNAIFFRSERPKITEAFAQAKHLEFKDHHNCVDDLICKIPSILPRDLP